MRKFFWLFLLVFLLVLSARAVPARADNLQMTSESPADGQGLTSGTAEVSPGATTITITFNEPIWITAYQTTYDNFFSVSGKYHSPFFTASPSNTSLSSDDLTLSLNGVDLPEDDTITVALNEGIAPVGGSAADDFSFSFKTQAVNALPTFDDPVLEQAVRDTLGIPDDRQIYQSLSDDPTAVMPGPGTRTPIQVMDDLTSFTYVEYFGPYITSVDGLVYAHNLQYLTLNNNKISDLTPLQGLTQLKTINLDLNNSPGITSLAPLSNLTQLTELDLNTCNITSVAGLQGIGGSLTTLDLRNNAISDIGSLSGLAGLQTLYLSSNQIVNITPLIGLTSLSYLDLSNNQISDLSPLNSQTLTSLTYLNLNNNQILSGDPIGSLTTLTDLELDSNKLSSIGFLSKLTGLQILRLSTNNIVDITVLQNLTALQDLDLSGNRIVDISPLPGLTHLGTLNLSDNFLNDDCFQILEGSGLWKIAIIQGAQDFDLDQYEKYSEFVQAKGVFVYQIEPNSSTPSNEDLITVDGETAPIELVYPLQFNIPKLESSPFLSKVEVYVNGVANAPLTSSLSFDTKQTTIDNTGLSIDTDMFLDHDPFPNASTITIIVQPFISLYEQPFAT